MSKEIEKDFMNDIMSKCELEVEPKDIAMLLYDIYDVPSGICEQIKNMVQRLESIDNSNPSEAMESLERLNYHTTLEYQDSKEYYIVRQYIHKAQEQEKENKELKENIKRWHDLLLKSGIDSKGIVADEIENYWAIKAGV